MTRLPRFSAKGALSTFFLFVSFSILMWVLYDTNLLILERWKGWVAWAEHKPVTQSVVTCHFFGHATAAVYSICSYGSTAVKSREHKTALRRFPEKNWTSLRWRNLTYEQHYNVKLLLLHVFTDQGRPNRIRCCQGEQRSQVQMWTQLVDDVRVHALVRWAETVCP